MFTTEEVKKAMRVYYYLLEHGELSLKDDQELYRYYGEESIEHLLEIMASETSSIIKMFDDTIYLMPNPDNEFLGFKRAELKKEIFSGRADARNLDLYLAVYIIIIIIMEFYSGEGIAHKIRDSISLGEIDQKLHERLEPYRSHHRDEINSRTNMKIVEIADMYFEMLNMDDASSVKTRRWYINSVVRFLSKQELVTIKDETIMIPTIKFDRLIKYSLDLDNLEAIRAIFNDTSDDGGEA